jgi:molecular chaperone DnaK (HSP70)
LIVFSIPSYYTQIEKIALINAGLICGLKNVQLVSENGAIGLDYRGFKKSEAISGKNVVFIDFGYSKLSVGFIRFVESKIDIVY